MLAPAAAVPVADMAVELVRLGSQVGIVFGGVAPYIPQYWTIKKTRNTGGFSLHVCLALLVANILRILFWFGRHYELPLLFQSLLMIAAMLEMVRLCVSVGNDEPKGDRLVLENQSETGAEVGGSKAGGPFWTRFWKWTDFQSYLEAVSLFVAVSSLVTYLLLRVDVFVEGLGFAAVLTEALLGVPQFYRNWRNKSTYGMSLGMVLMWTSGDVFKTAYFSLRETPPQFVICGALQICVDLAILGQVWLYRSGTSKRRRKAELHVYS